MWNLGSDWPRPITAELYPPAGCPETGSHQSEEAMGWEPQAYDALFRYIIYHSIFRHMCNLQSRSSSRFCVNAKFAPRSRHLLQQNNGLISIWLGPEPKLPELRLPAELIRIRFRFISPKIQHCFSHSFEHSQSNLVSSHHISSQQGQG